MYRRFCRRLLVWMPTIIVAILIALPERATAQEKKEQQADPHAGHHMPDMKPKGDEQMPPHDHSKMTGHEGMHMPGMGHDMGTNDAGAYLMTMASGTSVNP